MAKLNAQEKQWQAESDARTLTQAVEVENSGPRKKAALGYLKKQAAEINKVVKKTSRKKR